MNVRLRRECVCERVCVGEIQAAVGRSRAALFTRNHPNLSDFYKRIMKERKNLWFCCLALLWWTKIENPARTSFPSLKQMETVCNHEKNKYKNQNKRVSGEVFINTWSFAACAFPKKQRLSSAPVYTVTYILETTTHPDPFLHVVENKCVQDTATVSDDSYCKCIYGGRSSIMWQKVSGLYSCLTAKTSEVWFPGQPYNLSVQTFDVFPYTVCQ